jgi:hypothetical protein
MATDGPAQGSNKNQLALAQWQRMAQHKDPTLESAGLGVMATDGPVGVYIVMVCRWTDHILARNPLLEVEADLPDGGNFPTRFSLINWRATNSK